MTALPANFAKVDGRLWRGAVPNTVQAELLVSQGVCTVINLEWEQADDVNFADSLTNLVRIKDFEPLPWIWPSLSDDHVVRALLAIRAGPPIVYVHCRSGQNRTGVIVAAYRLIEKGDSLDVVLTDFASFQGIWVWPDSRYIRNLATRRLYFRQRLAGNT